MSSAVAVDSRSRRRRRLRKTAPRHFEIMRVGPPPHTLGRAAATIHHLVALGAGALVARGRRPAAGLLARSLRGVLRWFVRRDLRDQPFPVQFRRRLELLGPTYIKLGQILSLREDILPVALTDELKNLLDQLPIVPFPIFRRQVESELGRRLEDMFSHVDEEPIGSASIAQIHRATTITGDRVVLKVVKPGIPETLVRDARLLRLLGGALQAVLPHYQPRRMIQEFCDYTLREVDLRREADNAETFAANFADLPDVAFPEIYREYSGKHVLCMEYFDGIRPDAPAARHLAVSERERLIDLGAQSIIRMLYRDGVFHADLHPGNLLILPGERPEAPHRVGFIDLGMVGRLDPELRHILLFYYYSLVSGDAESAARYLTAAAVPGVRGDPRGFHREIAEISSRWRLASTFEGFSLARLILESVVRGAQFEMYFPVEMVLMVKALITFEGVGHMLLPGFDVASVSRRHIRHIFLDQFSPVRIVTEGAREAPDVLDAVIKLPLLVTEGVRVLDRSTRPTRANPFAGIRGTLIAGFCLVAASILMAFAAPWPVWSSLFVLALILAVRRGE